MRLTPPIRMTLEKALAYIEDDELVEVTPKSIRLRKKLLDPNERKRDERRQGSRTGVRPARIFTTCSYSIAEADMATSSVQPFDYVGTAASAKYRRPWSLDATVPDYEADGIFLRLQRWRERCSSANNPSSLTERESLHLKAAEPLALIAP